SHWETLVSGVRSVCVVAPGLSSLVTEQRKLARQNHRGGVSSASPSSHRGVDPLCPQATPTRAAGDRSLCCFIRQATAGHGEMIVHSILSKVQQPSILPWARALARPERTRSEISERSNSAIAEMT